MSPVEDFYSLFQFKNSMKMNNAEEKKIQISYSHLIHWTNRIIIWLGFFFPYEEWLLHE